MDLRPGEHIQIDNIPRRFSIWPVTSRSSWSFSSSSNATPLRNGHHMLVVRPLSTKSVLVIHMTESGVKEGDVSLDATNVVVLEHECTHIGEDAIRNARDGFDTHYDSLLSNDEQFVHNARGIVNTHDDATDDEGATQQEAPAGSVLREIRSLFELKPGDHIREETNTTYKHHLLVVEVVDVNRVHVIHKLDTGVIEENKVYRPNEIRVLDYNSPYKGDQIIQRARELPRTPYNARSSNCEHFVREAHTGQRESTQVRRGFINAVIGGLSGAVVGVAAGAVAGAAVAFIPGAILGGIVGGVGGAVAGTTGGAAVGLRAANRN